MRPVPSRKHHLAVLVILLVVVANTAITFQEKYIQDDQANLLVETISQRSPELYRYDSVFSHQHGVNPWRIHLPGWGTILRAVQWLAGSKDPLDALRILGAFMLLLYLMSMYILLYRQSHSTTVAVLVALLSMSIFSTARPYWGMGPLFTVVPANIPLIFIPILAWGFVRWHRRWSILWVFFGIGLIANIHASSAFYFAIVIILAMLFLDGGRLSTWIKAAFAIPLVAIGASGAIWYYFHNLTICQFPTFRELFALQQRIADVEVNSFYYFYPQVIVEILRWLPVAVMLAIPSVIILARQGRYRADNLDAWVWLLVAVLVISIGGHLLWNLAGKKFPALPTVNFFEAIRFAMLPLYVLLAQAIVQLIRMSQTHRGWITSILTILSLAFIGSSYNTLEIRRMVRDTIATISGKHALPHYLAQRQREEELQRIALWARRNTPSDSLFITDRATFRLFARRSITASPADLPYWLYLAPYRLNQWTKLIVKQHKLLHSSQGSTAVPEILKFIHTYLTVKDISPSLISTTFNSDTPRGIYLLIRTTSAPKSTRNLKEIPPPNNQWGQYWRIFRVKSE